MKRLPLVTVRCLVYNHEPYLRQCLDGFVMQKTNFAFEAIVHDDASTDNSVAIIREYAEKYPDIIKPIYETENQYRKGTIGQIMDNAVSPSSKYIAMCEGDDYWTDPNKLQKQVDFLETHPEYTMVCNRTKLYSEQKKKCIGENYCYNHDRFVKTKDVIYRSGLFISTCSIVYRKEIKDNYPDYCKQCVVGDYPLQIMAAMKGYIFYFDAIMSVYRVANSHSWMANQEWYSISERNLKRINSMIDMFNGFSVDFPQFKKYFKNKIAEYLINQSPNRAVNGKDYNIYKEYFKSYYKEFPLFWKIVDRAYVDLPKFRGLYMYALQRIYKRYLKRQQIY